MTRLSLTFLLDVVLGVVLGGCGEGIKPTATIAATDSADQVLIAMSHYVTEHGVQRARVRADTAFRSEEHTSELQSQSNLVCRLLLEKKKKQNSAAECHVSGGSVDRPCATLLSRTD